MDQTCVCRVRMTNVWWKQVFWTKGCTFPSIPFQTLLKGINVCKILSPGDCSRSPNKYQLCLLPCFTLLSPPLDINITTAASGLVFVTCLGPFWLIKLDEEMRIENIKDTETFLFHFDLFWSWSWYQFIFDDWDGSDINVYKNVNVAESVTLVQVSCEGDMWFLVNCFRCSEIKCLNHILTEKWVCGDYGASGESGEQEGRSCFNKKVSVIFVFVEDVDCGASICRGGDKD